MTLEQKLMVMPLAGIRFDGVWPGPALAFTDIDFKSPAYRGSFAVPFAEATPAGILTARDEQRARFGAAATTPAGCVNDREEAAR